MKSFFKELYEYSHHFNQRLMEIFLAHQDATSDRSLQLLNHLVNAQHVWNSRILGISPRLGVWDLHLFEDLKSLDIENMNQSIYILDQKDLENIISYTNTKGGQYSNIIRDILFHVINHSTHHRAQISSDLKINGIEPIPMDYVFYKR